jgi:uncharacterized protein (TIGR03437 family)
MLRMKEEGLLDCKLRPFSRLLAASLFVAFAQTPTISDLATTDDGYHVYFRVNASAQIGGVYRLSENRVEPLLIDPRYDLSPSQVTQRYVSPAVSDDGRTVVAQFDFRCSCCSFCIGRPNYVRSVVMQRGVFSTNPGGFGSLSANGRFLFHAGTRRSIGIDEQYRHLRDLGQNGDDIDTGLAPLTFRYAVSNDGRVINRGTADSDGVVIWSRASGARRLPIPHKVADAAINSGGTYVAYEALPGGVALLDLTSNSLFPISDSGKRVSFASVAGRVVFIENGRAFDYDIASRRRRQLYPGEVTDVVESTNGNVAYVVNEQSQIVRIELPSLESRIVYTRLRGFFTSTATEVLVPGSLFPLRGPLPVQSAQASFPLPTELGGVRVTVGGVPAPIVSVEPSGLVFQVPQSLSADTVTVDITVDRARLTTGFTAAVRQRDARFLPATFPSAGGQPAVYHEGFTGVVTEASPARSYETVHLYGVAFGSVDAAIPDGLPVPSSPPARVTDPPRCTLSRFPDPAVDIALAPGFAGIYQINVTIPRNVSVFTSQLSCGGSALASIAVAP